jgi:serpin B
MKSPLQLVAIYLPVFITMAATQLSQIPEVKDMAEANTRFTLDLLRQCGEAQKGQNIFLGPFSITTALAMTHMGAAGDTAQEMKSALCWNKEAPLKGFGSYLPMLQKDASGGKGYVLVGAQRVYVDKTITLKQQFSEDVQVNSLTAAKFIIPCYLFFCI